MDAETFRLLVQAFYDENRQATEAIVDNVMGGRATSLQRPAIMGLFHAARRAIYPVYNSYTQSHDLHAHTQSQPQQDSEREHHLTQQLLEAQQHYGELAENHENAQKEIIMLHRSIEDLRRTLQLCESQAERCIGEQQVRIKELDEKNNQLRAMMVPANEQQVIDAVLIQKFTSLRSLVLRLVKTTWTKEMVPQEMSPHQRQFAKSFLGENLLPLRFRENRLRGEIFILLVSLIFNVRHYGFGEELKNLDNYIASVEKFWDDNIPAEHKEVMTTWRVATMKCVERLSATEFRPPTVAARDTIWKHLSILALQSEAAKDNGKKLITRICEEAYELNLLMRKSQDTFVIKTVSKGAFAEGGPYADDVDEEPIGSNTTHRPGHVAFCVFGALVKHVKGVRDPIVLEKAEVVVYMAQD